MTATPVVIASASKHTATIIFLHGLGDTGYGWASAIAAIRPSCVKVICPTAPTMPVSLNGGYRMPSWFDLKGLDVNSPEDEAGIKKAVETVHGLIASEEEAGSFPFALVRGLLRVGVTLLVAVLGVAARRVVVGGFSQGGALALYSALSYPRKLGGVMALSCWLPLRQSFPAAALHPDLPIIQCHGDSDPLVPFKYGQMTASNLKKFCSNFEFKSYQGLSHASSDEEMRDLKGFVEKYLPDE